MEFEAKYPVILLKEENLLLPLSELAEIARERVNAAGAGKVNIVAWSVWGLAARIIANEMPERIASVSTVCTPHRGLRTVDKTLGKPALKCWRKLVNAEPKAFELAVKNMSPEFMSAFNEKYPDAEAVFYQSAACAMNPGDDKRLAAANNIISILDGENDGVVSVYSALWGQYGRVHRGVSHLSVPQEIYDDLIKNLIRQGL